LGDRVKTNDFVEDDVVDLEGGSDLAVHVKPYVVGMKGVEWVTHTTPLWDHPRTSGVASASTPTNGPPGGFRETANRPGEHGDRRLHPGLGLRLGLLLRRRDLRRRPGQESAQIALWGAIARSRPVDRLRRRMCPL